MGMDFFAGLVVFIFGAVVGSFLNVVILRLNTGQSVVFGQSKCFSCAKKLKWHELLPIVSFVFLRGKCSACKTKISWQYLVVETITGLIFLQIFNLAVKPPSGVLLYLWAVFSLLIIIAAYDYRHQIIPNLFVWIFNGLVFLRLISSSMSDVDEIFYDLLAGVILFAFFAALWGISKGKWMGFGDAKLALGIGWLLGMAKSAAAITLAFWIGAIVGVLLLYFGKKKYGMKSAIAFGPFMILGTAISFFWGERLISFLFW